MGAVVVLFKINPPPNPAPKGGGDLKVNKINALYRHSAQDWAKPISEDAQASINKKNGIYAILTLFS